MNLAANLVVGLVALAHVGFGVLEMFLWNRPVGRRIFRTAPEFAAAAAPLAANQGLYNWFLAAGLVWGLFAGGTTGEHAKLFFLACVVVAGVYGAATVNRRIVLIQAAPAALGLALVLAA